MIKITRYKKEDLKQIQSWWKEANFFVERPSQKWNNYVTSNKNVSVHCLHKQQKILSYIQCDVENKDAYICVVTNPKYCRKGYGTKLMRYIERKLKIQNIKNVYAYVELENNSSINFFRKNKYIEKSRDSEFIYFAKCIK